LLAAAGALAAVLGVDAAPVRAPAADAGRVTCGHLGLVLDVTPRTTGCEECLRLGERWVHLRVCLSCRHVGCGDSSRHRPAAALLWRTARPVGRSLERGETWRWCYEAETAV